MDTSRYADLFLTESREHLSAINHALLALEREGGGGGARGSEAVGSLFRSVHTVKGMSATMGYAPVAELSHEMESLLDRLRRGAQEVTPAVMDALFASADSLEQAIEAAVNGRGGEQSPEMSAALARLRRLGARGSEPSPIPPPSAASAPPADGATAEAGAATAVRVQMRADAPLRGVRAFMVVQKARSLGQLLSVTPQEDRLQSDDFAGEIALRIVTTAAPAEIERVLRSAGDVETVDVAGAAATPAPADALPAVAPAAPVPAPPAEQRAGAGTAAESAPARHAARHVRIDLRRLDALMNLIGELVITRGRLMQISAGLADPALEETVSQASRLISDLQDEIMTSRMVPVWQVFDRFPRLVRDAARSLGKEVDFEVEGKEIELDRSMLDEIGDPIVHLLRNAIDHGVESPDERVAAGKPASGRLRLSAMRDRSAVIVRVADDGRGIDRQKVLRRARATGVVEAGKEQLSDEELIRLISRPGFSTAERVTDISGRGVGIDAVQTRVRTLGGSVEIRSVPGEGTAVTVRLPLTLAIVRALLARVAGELYALPMQHVSETVDLHADVLRTVRGSEVLVLRDEVLPLLRLRELAGLPRDGAALPQVVILEVADRRAGLVVDELTGQQEIVVKQFDAVRSGLAIFGGATILGDGAPALILDVASLL